MRKVDGLIMAGGIGSRFGVAEKPMARLKGRPMIDYVVAAVRQAVSVKRVYVAVSPHTPNTKRHLEEAWRGSVQLVQTPGAGYVEDLRYAAAQIKSQVILVCPADMPLLREALLDAVVNYFFTCGKSSLVAVVPLQLVVSLGLKPTLVMKIDGEDFVPSGVNVVDGVKLASGGVLEECYFKSSFKEFAVNVNTREELEVAKKLLETQVSLSVL
ncbi:MAG: NTP transferase domain-containing protein [Candidatus Jordarchaeales archaeon]